MAEKSLTQRRRDAETQRLLRAMRGILLVFSLAAFSVFAQSGRVRPTPAPTGETPRPGVVTVAPTPAPEETPATKAQTTPTPEGPQTVIDDEVVRITSRLVGIPASVIGSDGKPLTDLTADDFELLIDGAKQDFGSLERFEAPVKIAFLFDNSSSQNPSRILAREAATKFFRRVLRRQDQAAIVLVTTTPLLVQPLTDDVKKLVATVGSFPKPAGATALLDAVMLASEQLRHANGRRVIVMVTDGEDTSSEVTFEQSLLAAQAADCQLYIVQTGYLDNANVRRLAAERRLEEFAAQTGGAIYTPFKSSDLPRAFDQIAADLAQQYVIGYYPPTNQPADGAFHSITLRVKNHPDASIRARQGYYAKGRQPQN